MTDLTQLEKEILTHPTLRFFLDSPQRPTELLDLDKWARKAAHLTDSNELAPGDLIPPSRIAKDWDEISTHLRSLLILLAKIQRDKKHPEEETLAHDLFCKVFFKKGICFRWEREEHLCQVAQRRKGIMNVLFIEFQIVHDESHYQILHAIRQYCLSLARQTGIALDHFFFPASETHNPLSPQRYSLLTDIPSLKDLMKRIPRQFQKHIKIHRFRVPRIYQTEINLTFDALTQFFVLILFPRVDQTNKIMLPAFHQFTIRIKRRLDQRDFVCFLPKNPRPFPTLLIHDPNPNSTQKDSRTRRIHEVINKIDRSGSYALLSTKY